MTTAGKSDAEALKIALGKLAFQESENEKMTMELIEVRKELVLQKHENKKQFKELAVANHELKSHDDENEKQGQELLIERIKAVIFEIVHQTDETIKIKFSHYLSEKLNRDYTYMSNLFSEQQGVTIEQFIISHKVERIKELILNDKLSITEIAWKMNYSSVSHLSFQFKKVTGLTTSQFKKLNRKRQTPD
jgi:AraC-like DNA-binding protein